MRIVICGQKEFGARVFDATRAAGHEVLAVFAPVAGAGVDRLAERAEAAGVPLFGRVRPEAIPEGADVLVCAHAHDFVSRAARERARLGAIGYHPSLLPLHRGKDAIRWAIKMGDRVTGGTVYQLTDEVDAGPILAQEFCFIRPGDTPAGLWRRELQGIGVRLLLRALHGLEAGEAVPRAQDEAIATWEPSWEREPLASGARAE